LRKIAGVVANPLLRAVNETDLPQVCAFLEQHANTSMFMLSNLAMNGPRIGEALNSGDFKMIEKGAEICAVFCLTRRTSILAEAGGRTEFAPAIVEACRAEPIPIGGVLGEWKLAEAIWSVLRNTPGFKEMYAGKEILQTLDLAQVTLPAPRPQVRPLRAEDFEHWDLMNAAFCAEEGLPLLGTPADRQALFVRSAAARRWWGYFEDGHLLAMAGLNAVYKQMGQVGGVFTAPDRRRAGLSRATMNALLSDAVLVHELGRLVLFTGEHSHAARPLYQSLGFITVGDFALLMCAPIG
jgi:RimJ/RimL family protein N-acetyltransferase